MYKIMLADDEGIVINSLKFIIEKNFRKDCVIESAKTGRGVIELAERFRPDISFMDIQMPGINGIEAIKEIKKISPTTIFIILSAYDQFEYAKEAINLGVLEYLTKPVNQKTIVDVIRKCIQVIEREKEKRSNDLLIKEKLEIVLPVIESGFIYAILFQEEASEDIDKYKELLEIQEDYGYIMVIEYGDTIEKNDLSNTIGVSIKAQKFSGRLKEIIKEYFKCIVGTSMTNKTVVFVPYQYPQLDYGERNKIIDKSNQMLCKLKQKIDIEFKIGIGNVKHKESLVESYKEAIIAMKNSEGLIAHFTDLTLRAVVGERYPIEIEELLLRNIQLGKVSEMKINIDRYFECINKIYPQCNMDIKLIILEIILYSERKILLNEGIVHGGKNPKNYLVEINKINTYEQLKKWFLESIEYIYNATKNKKYEQSNICIEKAKEYIKRHYQKNISLEEVSREVGISHYYFSKLFKDIAGENFIEYLTRIRIEVAKELLHSGRSVKEVGIQVGYNDPNYFSRIFKKSVGITPRDFKEDNH